jgi:hypothetical protein
VDDKVLEDSKRPSLVHIGKMSFSVLASRRGWRERHLVHKAHTTSGVRTSGTQDMGDVLNGPPIRSHRTSSVELEVGLYSTCACRVQPVTWKTMSIPDAHHSPGLLAQSLTSKNTLAPPGLEALLRVPLTPQLPGLRVRLADYKRLRGLRVQQTRPRREGRTRPARSSEMCKENQRVLPF